MATERQWFTDGVLIDEREPSTEFFAEGVQVNETVVAVGGTTVTPTTAALTLTPFAPTVTATAPPTDVIATPLSSSSIGLAWTHPGGATTFRLRRRIKTV